ncbi:hexokinase-3-like protein isoform X1 [Tanacetum coccineum]
MTKVGLGIAVGCAVASSVIAAVMVGRRVRSWRRWWKVVKVVDEFEENAVTSVVRLRQVVDAMAVEMHAGLASEGGSKLKMLLTFVDNLPDGLFDAVRDGFVDNLSDGTESGTYYALHVGGTNFRILRIQLGGQRSILRHDVERKPIPLHLMTSTSEELFDFIALSLKEFVEQMGNNMQLSHVRGKDIGFTFSFPVKQTSVSSGTLIKWTKGFTIEDMVEKDVVDCLQKALARRGLDMNVAALVNDSVGTLALGHFYDKDTVAAVVIGTGTNACYFERADAVIKCQGLLTTSGGMVINMEWGNFWSSHLPRTSYDIDLDAESQNPNDQGFEKMISGMYLGDIVRRVIHKISLESDIFGPVSSKLSARFALSTPLLAAMHEDDSFDLKEVARILEETLDIRDVSLKVRKLVVKVCDVVTRRAARLAAAGIVGILKKIGRDGTGGITSGRIKGGKSGKMRRTVVAVEGGLYTSYTMFREYLNEAVAEILGEEIAPYVILKVMEDGSGIGSAMLAAAYSARSVDTVQVL